MRWGKLPLPQRFCTDERGKHLLCCTAHSVGFHRADDHDDHAVRAIVCLMELADSLYAEARECVRIAQQRQSVRVIREPLGEQGVAGGADGVGVMQGVLVVQDEPSLLLQRVSRQGRVQQTPQQGLQRLAPAVGQHAGAEARPVALGGGVQYAACMLKRAVQCIRRQADRAAKE
jgi:hypothetical protein